MMDDMKDQRLTYRRKDGRINVAVHTEDDLRYVLGGYYDQCHSRSFNETEWKKIVRKLVGKLEIAIKRNVDTDRVHKQDISRHVRLIREAVSAKPMAEPQVIVKLICLAFELMGEMPCNKRVEHAREERYFDLNRHRTVRYFQTPRQKAKLIVHCAEVGRFKKVYGKDDIESKWYGEFDQDPVRFLDWYKTTYPKLYAELF
jgi:hypothetical protein